jgi:hypothetical protein
MSISSIYSSSFESTPDPDERLWNTEKARDGVCVVSGRFGSTNWKEADEERRLLSPLYPESIEEES